MIFRYWRRSGFNFLYSAVDKNGMNNPMNYGLRTMVSDAALYVGTANPMNLHPYGGWELIRLVSH
jgi:hypothetical protein